VILDVAHNPHAASELAANLDAMGFGPRTHAVFGMLRDKDVAGVVARLAPAIDVWHVGPTPGTRGATAEALAQAVRAGAARETLVHVHATLADAYRAALAAADPDDRIIVFGSFTTVAEVMRARERAASAN
jgi:dihydrofolate synthase/folylpolyglutamate synthase